MKNLIRNFSLILIGLILTLSLTTTVTANSKLIAQDGAQIQAAPIPLEYRITDNDLTEARDLVAPKAQIEVFERLECGHCQDEKAFLNKLATQRSDFTVNFRDITEPENEALWLELTELEGLSKSTPVTLVGNTVILGFDTDETTGKRIEKLIDLSIGEETLTVEEYIASGGSGNVESFDNGTCDIEGGECIEDNSLTYDLPFLGPTDLKQYSLPTLSIILGFIDGFNPCAMWVLVTFLIVLVQAGSRKRMWQIAGLFIAAEAIMYYLILNVWMTTWNFVKLDNIITPIIGLVAIGGGIFFLYEWYTSDGTCKVTNGQKRAKISEKISNLVKAELTIATIVGILGLALSVNIIEFACSIGIPQTFTKILDLNLLDTVTQQFYMLLYIIFYMVDDFIVFGIALYSFEKIGLTSKYSKLSNLAGGILMVILGLILLIDPSLLVF